MGIHAWGLRIQWPRGFTSLPADTNTKTFQASVFPRTLFRIPIQFPLKWYKCIPQELSRGLRKDCKQSILHCCLLNPQADAMTCCSYNRTKAERLLNGLRPWQSIYWGHRCSIQMLMIPNQFHQRYCCYSMHFSLLDVKGRTKRRERNSSLHIVGSSMLLPWLKGWDWHDLFDLVDGTNSSKNDSQVASWSWYLELSRNWSFLKYTEHNASHHQMPKWNSDWCGHISTNLHCSCISIIPFMWIQADQLEKGNNRELLPKLLCNLTWAMHFAHGKPRLWLSEEMVL